MDTYTCAQMNGKQEADNADIRRCLQVVKSSAPPSTGEEGNCRRRRATLGPLRRQSLLKRLIGGNNFHIDMSLIGSERKAVGGPVEAVD